jgi:hypothetical protein
MPYFLITSLDTGKQYKKQKLKGVYKNIKTGRIQRVYEIKRDVGYINNGNVYKTNKK